MMEEIKQDVKEIKREAETTISPLVAGIIEDAQTLFRQEIALAKTEIKEDIQHVKTAAIGFGIGAGLSIMCLVLLSFSLVHLLSWLFPDMPLWASYAVVTLVYAAAAVLAGYQGKQAIEKADFVPHQTIQTLKENAQWAKQKM